MLIRPPGDLTELGLVCETVVCDTTIPFVRLARWCGVWEHACAVSGVSERRAWKIDGPTAALPLFSLFLCRCVSLCFSQNADDLHPPSS